MMVALLLYAYARGVRSSRAIERRLRRGRRLPRDRRATRRPITRRSRGSSSATRRRWPGCSARCSALCAQAGLVKVAMRRGRRHEGAGQRQPRRATRDYEQIAARDPRGGRGGRRGRGRALRRSARRRAAGGAGDRRGRARSGCARPSAASSDARRAAADPAPRPKRLRRPSAGWKRSCGPSAGQRAYEDYRRAGDEGRRRFGRPPKPYTPPATPQGKINSPIPTRARQGLARLAAGLQRAGRRQRAADRHRRRGDDPRRLRAPRADVDAASASSRRRRHDAPEVLLADAGYWHQDQMEALVDRGIPVLDPARRQQAQRHPAGLGRRPLRVHAPRPGHRARRRALRQAPGDDRAGLRQHQVQPRHRPLPADEAEPPCAPNGG